jgi:SAM-dependent methyltransferase
MHGINVVKHYATYQEYVDHQSSKTLDPKIREYFLQRWNTRLKWFHAKFRRTLKEVQFTRKHGKAALCLGARYGHEVQAFRDLNLDAEGIDLVPCPPLVKAGDIHSLEYPDESQNIVFTNIFDHSYNPDAFLSEIDRVLVHGGFVIIHLAIAKSTDEFGVIEIETSKPIINRFHRFGVVTRDFQRTGDYQVVIDRAFPKKWGGLNWEVVLQKI